MHFLFISEDLVYVKGINKFDSLICVPSKPNTQLGMIGYPEMIRSGIAGMLKVRIKIQHLFALFLTLAGFVGLLPV